MVAFYLYASGVAKHDGPVNTERYGRLEIPVNMQREEQGVPLDCVISTLRSIPRKPVCLKSLSLPPYMCNLWQG